MLFSSRHSVRLLALILLFLLTACGGGGGGGSTTSNPSLSRIEVTPSQPSLAKGTTLNLVATGIYSDDSTRTLTSDVSWQSSDDAIASPSVNGKVSALAAGQADIQASLDGITGSTALTVTDAVLSRLEISPGNAQLALDTTLDLSVLGLYSDGSGQDLTQQVAWNSADTGILNIDSSGRIQPQSAGSTTVTAAFAGIVASQTVTVSGAVLATIEISSTSDTIPLGSSQPLLALGHYSDDSLQDITEQVVWQGTPANLMDISNTVGSRGLATALAVGSVSVTATLSGINGTLNLSTSAATLSSIDITPLNTRLAAGTQTTFRATGHYSDGTIQDVSERVSWSTADTGTAIISNAPGERGLALALTSSSTATTISASLDGVISDATLTVTPAQLLSINITPPELTLPAGTQRTVHAEGNFTDGSVQVLDGQVTWESDTPSIATVSNGTISALLPNTKTARISASLDGISGNTAATVTDATLSSLTINPSSPALAVDTETQLQVIATYSDSSQTDVTTQATWSNDADTHPRLRVENSAGRQGRLTALTIGGPVVVTANFGGMQTSVSVSIGSATLNELNIVTGSTSMDSAEQQQLTAIGTFSDSTTQDLTDEVIWSSDAPSLASVSNNAGDRGQVVAGINVSGVAVITASLGSFSPNLNLTVNNTPQRPVSLVVFSTPNVILNDGLDASILEVRVQAADPADMALDGTAIQLQILQNDIVLTSEPLVTSGGIASTSFTTTETGLLQITATITGTAISNSTALYTSDAISDVIAGTAFADAQISGTTVLSGGRFGFILYNLSNRDFALNQFVLLNGSDVLLDTDDPAVLNGKVLTGGLKLGFIYQLEMDITNKGIVAYYDLTDPTTGDHFYPNVIFTAPPP